jgi:hypothetical protein
VQGVGIESVSAPRQSLEELFLDIVERARAEQIATSGAQSGGRIASFLQDGEGAAAGTEMVEQLVRASAQPAAAAAKPVEQPAAPSKSADNAVLDSLLAQAKPAATQPPAGAPAARKPNGTAAADVDRGLIDSLLDDAGRRDDTRGEGRG